MTQSEHLTKTGLHIRANRSRFQQRGSGLAFPDVALTYLLAFNGRTVTV
jgi:hypothetical protein